MTKSKFCEKYYILTSLVGVFALFLSSCAGPPQHHCFFVQNGAEHRVSWNQNLPVVLWIHDVPSEYRDAFYRAEEIWEEKLNRDFFTFQEINADLSDIHRNDNRSIIYWDETWSGKETEQAKTTIHWVGSQITDADIRFNAHHYPYYTDVDIEGGPEDFLAKVSYSYTAGFEDGVAHLASLALSDTFRSVSEGKSIHLESLIIHELGHVLGLKHNSDKESVMQKSLSGRTERNIIGNSDSKNIQCEYGGLDV